jgi:hypothetical protein
MTTITAVADNTNAAVTLDITATAAVSRITRTDANGTHDVRVMRYQLEGTGKHIAVDYEATHGLNTYAALGATGTVLATATATLAIQRPWLSVPVLPELSVTVQQITGYSASRTSSSVVHQVIGRTDPVVNLGKLGLRQGVLEIWTPDYLSARSLESVVDSGEIVMLKQSVPGLDMFFTALETEAVPYTPEGDITNYRFTVRYLEVSRPAGYLRGGRGWTFDELAGSFNTFDEVTAAYSTFDNLTLNQEL